MKIQELIVVNKRSVQFCQSAAFSLACYTLVTLVGALLGLMLGLTIRLLCFTVKHPRVAAVSVVSYKVAKPRDQQLGVVAASIVC